MSRVVHFEISAEDVNRAKMFYTNVFGWKIKNSTKNLPLLIFPGNNNELESKKANSNHLTSIGIGSIQQRGHQENICITFSVSNIDESIKMIEVNGGQILSPKFPVQGIGYIIICQDTEGNIFRILESDPLADTLLWVDFTDHKKDQPTLVEQLGYPKDAILVIVHADDIGMHSKQTDGALDAMKFGMCKTGSIMVPCPDINRVMDIWMNDPELDLGIHLTLNSYWGKTYGWSPLLSQEEVPSLYNPDGIFWQYEHELKQHLNVEEAIKELEAQIVTILEAGLKPTHIDDHMGSYFCHPDLGKGIEELSKKYNLPLIPYYRDTARERGYVYPNTFWQFSLIFEEKWNPKARKEAYHNWLRNLQPGVHEVVTHISFMSEELEKILESAGSAHSYCRTGDYDVWTSQETKNLAEELGIIFIGYRELQKLQAKNWKLKTDGVVYY
jgi:predicted enzyme related to lactoylglutathione lyase/predicted glycoside hydrolase/deacetylase ChbG (UPF0249 family)